MSYEKQTWANGDVITANKLNHMEDGIAGGGVLVVSGVVDGAAMTLDKTWQEIYDAKAAVLWFANPELSEDAIANAPLVVVGSANGAYRCDFGYFGSSEAMSFTATSADGYPSTTLG